MTPRPDWADWIVFAAVVAGFIVAVVWAVNL